MKTLRLSEEPEVRATMLIRKPVSQVFEAFLDPAVTRKFWFTRSTGRLKSGGRVTWTWEMYGVSADVHVRAIEPNERILIEWGDPGAMTDVEWMFTPHGDDATLVSVTNSGFQGDGDQIVAQALDSLGGFTTVLDGAKAWLEHGIELNLIRDKFPGQSKDR